MSDTAQNKDEVGAILSDFLDGSAAEEAWIDAKKQLDQYYADFYRSKILEARKDSLKKLVSDMDEMGRLTQYKQIRTHTIKCIDDITAQFNSTEGCGICGDGGHSAFACTNQSQSTKQESR